MFSSIYRVRALKLGQGRFHLKDKRISSQKKTLRSNNRANYYMGQQKNQSSY
jgi:hypothetical protein